MTEYKKEPPRYHSWVDKEVTLENWLANILAVSEPLSRDPEWEAVYRHIKMSVLNAWDLVPEEKEWSCPKCKHIQDLPKEMNIICGNCYDTFLAKIQVEGIE